MQSFNQSQAESFNPYAVADATGSIIFGSYFAYAKDGIIELTKNSKYCVSKIPSTPASLQNHWKGHVGSIDPHTYYALAISAQSVHVWNYASPNNVPETYIFPPPPSTLPLLGLLVSPGAGSKEPGLILISPDSGTVSYWESVEDIVADNLLHKRKNVTYTVKLYSTETIEVIENIDQAGIVASTSSGRLILISFKDANNKPSLNSGTMHGTGNGFLTSLKGAISIASSRRNVLSIKCGKSLSRYERQAIVITAEGNVMIWECFRTGQSRLLLERNIREITLKGISTLYPHSAKTFSIHDLEYNEKANMIYVLTSFVNNPTVDEIFYIFFVLSLDQNTVHLVSSHKISSFTSVSSCRPQLLLPNPSDTLFILFSKAIVLTDALPKYPSSQLEKSQRWEDVISFLPEVKAFAFGKENAIEYNGHTLRHCGVIIMTKKSGLLRVERFKDERTNYLDHSQNSLAKTHIEQAIFYGHKHQEISPIDFANSKIFHFNRKLLEQAFLEISNEILTNSTLYLSAAHLSISENLQLRWEYMKYLVDFLHFHFPGTLSKVVRLKIMADVERLYAAKLLLSEYEKKLELQPQSTSVLPYIVFNLCEQAEIPKHSDNISSWFTSHLDKIGDLLVEAAKYCYLAQERLEIVEEVNFIFQTVLESAVFSIRKQILLAKLDLKESDYPLVLGWTGSQDLINACETQYLITTRKIDNTPNEGLCFNKLCSQLVFIVGTLCKLYSERIQWCAAGSTENKEAGAILAKDYERYRKNWVHVLISYSQKREAQKIAEQYKMYRTLVEIILGDLQNEADSQKSSSFIAVEIIEKLSEYIRMFGYEFANVLFQYFVEIKQLKLLLKQFSEFNEHLNRFFKSGNHGRISWIHDIGMGHYMDVAKTMLKVSNSDERRLVNKQLELSIAKLSAMASRDNSDAILLLREQIEPQIEHHNILESICDQLAPHVLQSNIALDGITKHLISMSLPSLIEVLHRAVSKLLQNKSLSVEELVDILTLLDVNSTSSELNFFRALNLLSLPTTKLSERKARLNYQLVWSRLYLQDE